MPSWTYTNKIITAIEDMPKDTYGFIYETTHKPTGKKYIGKKVLYFERNKKLGKKALQALKEERKAKGIGGRVPLKQKVITESDWKDYYGSHKDILDILLQDKKLLTYYECKYLFINEVLEQEDRYINDNILGKFYRKDFNETK